MKTNTTLLINRQQSLLAGASLFNSSLSTDTKSTMPSSRLLLLFQCNPSNWAHKSGITLDVAGVKWIEPIILCLIRYSRSFQLLCITVMTHIIRESYLIGSWFPFCLPKVAVSMDGASFIQQYSRELNRRLHGCSAQTVLGGSIWGRTTLAWTATI